MLRTLPSSLGVALIALCGCAWSTRQTPLPTDATSALTTIAIGTQVLHTGVRPFGINLSGQTYYDSGQMLRNLTFRNPGFEGGTWQSILHCKSVTHNSCTDENPYTTWPAGFLNGAQFDVISGAADGQTGIVLASSAAHAQQGVTLTLSELQTPVAAGDFLEVRIAKPGNADAGWWTQAIGGASIASERNDLSPDTPGKQALRVNADGTGQQVTVSSYFDSYVGHSFVQLHGVYRIVFRAKLLSGSKHTIVRVERLDTVNGPTRLLDRDVTLSPGWHSYTFDFPTKESGSAIGTVDLSFTFANTSALLDDIALTPTTPSHNNPTEFRDEVVQTLRELHPGILRYMDNGTDFGSSLDNMLAPPFTRERAGASTQSNLQQDIPIGLHEFLVLCKAIGAEPWYSMPAGTSTAEMSALIEYLGGGAHTHYGARRSALGQIRPWTEVFPSIHLELGNEQWNSTSFAGATIADPTAYGHRAEKLFTVARRSPYFSQTHFDLVVGTWASVPWWTQKELASMTTADTIAIAPYLFTDFNDASNTEAIFGPMLAQPEQNDSHLDSLLRQQRSAARGAAHPVNLAVYEVNLGTILGSVSQADVDAAVPSMGAALAIADHMLLMLRDLGITTQAMFALPEFDNAFTSSKGIKESTPLWGSVIDMGGATNRRRPSFYALQEINHAMLPNMLATSLTGSNPTWDQPQSANDHIQLQGAHLLQSFAFADGNRRSVILLNLSRAAPLPITFTGLNAPSGKVEQTILTSNHITDSNESQQNVKPVTTTFMHFDPKQTQLLSPFSITVLTWSTAQK